MLNTIMQNDKSQRPLFPSKHRLSRTTPSLIIAGILQLTNQTAHAGFSNPNILEVGGDIGPDAESVDDLNGDGLDDIIISLENKLMLLFGSQDGALKRGPTIRFFYPITAITTGDFDGNGTVDVAVQTAYGKVLTYSNPGTRPFELRSTGSFEATSSTVIQTTDFDNDGIDDLIVGSNVYYNDGTANFVLGEALPTKAVTGDIQGDDLPDIVNGSGEVLCGRDDGTFEPCAQVSVSRQLQVTADLNTAPGLEILSWTPSSFDQVARTYTVSHCGSGRTYRKLSGTRYAIRGSQYRRTTGCRWSTTIMQSVVATSAVVVSTVAADGTVSELHSADIPGVIGDLQLADFNADTSIDVLATNGTGGSYVFSGNGDGTLSAPELVTVTTSQSLIVGDWNGDHAADLAWFSVPGDGQDTMLYSALSTENRRPQEAEANVRVDPFAVRSATTIGVADMPRSGTPAPALHAFAPGSTPLPDYQSALHSPRPPADAARSSTAVPVDPPPSAMTDPQTAPTTAGQTIEIDGTIENTGPDYFVVNGLTIYLDSNSMVRFEDNTSGVLEIGQPAQGKVSSNSNGTLYAIRIEIGG